MAADSTQHTPATLGRPLLAAITFIYTSAMIALGLEWGSEFLQLVYLDAIVAISLLFYLGLLVATARSLRFFYFLAPIVIVSVPNALNDLFPSYAMGPLGEMGTGNLAFVTHIDLFFLLGIYAHRHQIEPRSSAVGWPLLIPLLASYICCYLLAFFLPDRHVGSFVVWAFQFRYAFLAAAFFQLNSLDGQRVTLIIWGLYLAALLTIVEALLFTHFSLDPILAYRLTSGNFGHNALGNLMAALAVTAYSHYFLVKPFGGIAGKLLYALFVVFSLAAFMTYTRMSALSLLVGIGLFHIVFFRMYRFSMISAVAALLFVLFSPLSPENLGNVGGYLKSALPMLFTSDAEDVASAVVASEAATVKTRMILWHGSIEMIRTHPLIGVGIGEWNFVKEDYDIHWKILLDPHNDYLYYLVGAGVLLGLLPLVLYYGVAWLITVRAVFGDRSALAMGYPPLALALTLSISAMSNANSHKHQLLMVLALVAFACLAQRSPPQVQTGLPDVFGLSS